MKPHKHAELIKAWADGAIIQQAVPHVSGSAWIDVGSPDWYPGHEYRVKPEPKPDVVRYLGFNFLGNAMFLSSKPEPGRLRLTFDGQTGELKSAEVLK